MDRRNFIRLGVAGAGAGIIAPQIALAGINKVPAGGVYYTKDAPGRWSKKATPHIPNMTIDKQGGSLKIKVVNSHPMDGFKHYIVKHVILDKNFNYLEEQMFDPEKDKAAISTFNFSVGSYSGPIYAVSLCNKHDTWLNVEMV